MRVTKTLCDVKSCRAEIPENAKVWELRAVLILHNGVDRQAETSRCLCSQACLTASLSELIKTVTEPHQPDYCHSFGGA